MPPGADCPVTDGEELVQVVNDDGEELRLMFETNDGTWEAVQPRLVSRQQQRQLTLDGQSVTWNKVTL